MTEPWLSAEALAVHPGTTNNAVADIADKRMLAYRVGRLWEFQVSKIDEWVRSGGAAPEAEYKGGGA